jgi:lysophospholipase L1-like esterase
MQDRAAASPESENSTSLESSQLEDSSKVMELPWLPSPRQIDHPWMSVAEWKKRVEQNAHSPLRLPAEIVFLGDSITEGWTDVAPEVWKDTFGAYHPLKLGIGGDQTQNILWRVDHGEINGLRPKILFLLIGVNNIWWGGFGPKDTAQGIAAVARKIREKLPLTKIVVQAIFPAGRRAHDELRQRIAATNQETQNLIRDIGDVTYVDLGIMHDFLHLTEKGYALWASALRQILNQHL